MTDPQMQQPNSNSIIIAAVIVLVGLAVIVALTVRSFFLLIPNKAPYEPPKNDYKHYVQQVNIAMDKQEMIARKLNTLEAEIQEIMKFYLIDFQGSKQITMKANP